MTALFLGGRLLAAALGLLAFHTHLNVLGQWLFYRQRSSNRQSFYGAWQAIGLLMVTIVLWVVAVGRGGLFVACGGLISSLSLIVALWHGQVDPEKMIQRYHPDRVDQRAAFIATCIPVVVALILAQTSHVFSLMAVMLVGSIFQMIRVGVLLISVIYNPLFLSHPAKDETVPSRLLLVLGQAARASSSPPTGEELKLIELRLARSALRWSIMPFARHPVPTTKSEMRWRKSKPGTLFDALWNLIDQTPSAYVELETHLSLLPPALHDDLTAVAITLAPRFLDAWVSQNSKQALAFLDRQIAAADIVERLRWKSLRLQALRQLGDINRLCRESEAFLDLLASQELTDALQGGTTADWMAATGATFSTSLRPEYRTYHSISLRLRYLLGIGSELDRLHSMALQGGDTTVTAALDRPRNRAHTLALDWAPWASDRLQHQRQLAEKRRAIEQSAVELYETYNGDKTRPANDLLFQLHDLLTADNNETLLALKTSSVYGRRIMAVSASQGEPLWLSLPSEALALGDCAQTLSRLTNNVDNMRRVKELNDHLAKLVGDEPDPRSVLMRREKVSLQEELLRSNQLAVVMEAVNQLTDCDAWSINLLANLSVNEQVLVHIPLSDHLLVMRGNRNGWQIQRIPLARSKLNTAISALRYALSQQKHLPAENPALRTAFTLPTDTRLLYYLGLGACDRLPLSLFVDVPFVHMTGHPRFTAPLMNEALGTALWSTKAPRPLSKTEEECQRLPNFSAKRACKEAVIEALQSPAPVHLACHALASTFGEREALLVLEDGQLSTSEIASLQVRAPLVYLSACETAIASLVPGAELPSLAQALLRAGAGAVVATKWRIPDDQSVTVAEVFWTNVRANIPPVQALHLARRALHSSHAHTFELLY